MNKVILFSIFLFFSSCIPAYTVFIKNNNNYPIYLKTHPEIESDYDTSFSVGHEDSIRILGHKVGKDGSYGIYKIMPNESFLLRLSFGTHPTKEDFPFDYLALINGNDTTVLDNKEKIFEKLKSVIRFRQGSFYIEVKK